MNRRAEHQFPTLRVGSRGCSCPEPHEAPRLVVVTGGPGAGKTAVLETAARSVCRHVAILPEAASIIFGGGFPRHETVVGRRATQAAIYSVQRQLEALVIGESQVAAALCDRGTVDGIAYWPDGGDSFWEAMGTTPEEELGRYYAVVHLGVPDADEGYVNDPIRTEPPERAAEIDRVITSAWEAHPRRFSVAAVPDFHEKTLAAMEAIGANLPDCCRG